MEENECNECKKQPVCCGNTSDDEQKSIKIDREMFFDTLDFMNKMNNLPLSKLDLSDFFENATEEKLLKVEERFQGTLNYNKIYLLITQPVIRDLFDIKLKFEEDAECKIS